MAHGRWFWFAEPFIDYAVPPNSGDVAGRVTSTAFTRKSLSRKERNLGALLLDNDSESAEDWNLAAVFPLTTSLEKMHENKICMRICRVCGRVFFASSKRFSLCSEECKRLKNRKNKQKFDDRARENGYDLDYKNVTQRMRHRKKRLFLREDIPEVAKQEVEAQFESFRKEALQMKKTVEDKESYKAFNNWMFDHERLFYDLCEKTEKES